MKKKHSINLETCRKCNIGSCCYEGAELSKKELIKILKVSPKIPKPWFRLVEKHEELDKEYPFTTIMRKGTCVFQDKNNRCAIYNVRPQNCREFPLEYNQAAPYYKRLCKVFNEQWGSNSSIRKVYKEREKK